MQYSQAREIAEKWVQVLASSCERIEIAGSVRRGKPEVHDIEICAVPKFVPTLDIFGVPFGFRSALNGVLDVMEGEGSFRVIKNGPKYKQLALPDGINLDLFIVTPPAQWGVLFLIRTGPAEFSHWIVTSKRARGGLPSCASVKDGAVWSGSVMMPMPEEADFFKFCGLPWIEPYDRQPGWK